MKGSVFLFLFGVLWTVFGCSTKNDYHYNVIDCKEPQIQALGDYILQKLKGQRDMTSSSCLQDNMKYLARAPFQSADHSFDAARLAGSWLYYHNYDKSKVFAGPLETIDALKNGRSYNIMVDKRFAVQRFVLRNSTDGAISIAFLTEEDLLSKMSSELYWNHLDMLDCQNFLYYLSKEFGTQMVSFTVLNRGNSNDELRFISKSGGIGGFYKLDGDSKE